MIGGRTQVIPVRDVTVKVSSPVNQDAAAILITRTDDDGEQFYVSDFVWSKYRGFDMLDVSNISTNVPVRVIATPPTMV